MFGPVQAARSLLTLDDKETKRLFEGEALLRRMYKYGLLEESQNKLDYVLALTPQVPRLPASHGLPAEPAEQMLLYVGAPVF